MKKAFQIIRRRPNHSRLNRRRGLITFEWLLLVTLLVIGIVGGLASVRNAIIEELNELVTTIQNLHDPEEEMEE